ncbi:MAG TPA: hypothetical protein VK845_16285 [Gemmatimonadales bacterium]|nr:hypothetical protein [Gemmatimonadales bacterium]
MAGVRFIDHRRFVARAGQAAALQAWLKQNEQQLAAAFPLGSQSLGLYGQVYGDGTGDLHLLIGLESYATLDVKAAAAADTETDFGRLVTELMSFFDLSNVAPVASWLYRAAADAVWWEN